MDKNEVHLVGQFGGDLTLRTSKKGTKWISTIFITNYRVKKADGNMTPRATYHALMAFGDIAEDMSKKFRKGSRAEIFGSLAYQQYLKNNINTWSCHIIVGSFNIPKEESEGKSSNKGVKPDKGISEPEIKSGYDEELPY